MSAPSPGPGWWLASDGEWYPQQWEYRSPSAYRQSSPENAWAALEPIVDKLGKQGWEAVNFSLNSEVTEGGIAIHSVTKWHLRAYMRRPLRPGQ